MSTSLISRSKNKYYRIRLFTIITMNNLIRNVNHELQNDKQPVGHDVLDVLIAKGNACSRFVRAGGVNMF